MLHDKDLQAGADATMGEQEIISYLFNSCFGFTIMNIDRGRLEEYDDYLYDNFRDILVKIDSKQYSELLYINCRLLSIKLKEKENNEASKDLQSDIDSEIKLVRLLLPFFSGSLPDIMVKKGGIITDANIIKDIGKLLQSEYYNKGFGYIPLSVEKAKEEIENKVDTKWIDNYMLKKDLGTWIQYEDMNPESMMLQEYTKEHLVKIDINEEYLLSRLEELEQLRKSTKKKAESLEESADIWRFAEKMSYILSFNRFKEQKKCLDIENFKITDRERKAIHDCLAFFKLIDDKSEIKSKNPTATTTPQKYVYQRLDYYKKNIKDKFEKEGEKRAEIEINLLRSYLNNEITRYVHHSDLSDNIKFLNYETFTLE